MRYLPFLLLLLLFSCTAKKEPVVVEKEIEVKYTGNIFNPLYLGKIIETPISMGPILDLETCKEFNISKISLYIKDGRNANKYDEKLVYMFNINSLPVTYFRYLKKEKEYPYSHLDFAYDSNRQIDKIDVTKYMGFSNIPPVHFTHDSTTTLSLTSRGNNRYDSLIFYPSISNPKMILSVVNNIVSNMEIVAEKGTQMEDWKMMAADIDSTLKGFELTFKIVTLTENGLPIASYDLDSNWNQKERVRSWEYNDENQPVYYKEWLHGSLVKLLEITYTSNNLPKMIIVDRKKYLFYSEFHAK